MERKKSGKHFKEVHKKNKKKINKKAIIKLCYWVFIICCFIISVLCLFKHGKEVNKQAVLQSTYTIQEEQAKEVIGKIESGEIKLDQNVPIPQELKEKMEREQAEKKAEEERKIAEQKAIEEQKRIEAEKKAEEERIAKEKAEQERKIAQTKQVTSRGGTTRETKATGTKAEYQAYAKDLCINTYGWTENDFNCLVKLVDKESSWNPNAVNKSSGAAGLFQALPASKMASEGSDYMTNYKTQIKWGLKYIKNRYGTPSKAWSFWQTHKWY